MRLIAFFLLLTATAAHAQTFKTHPAQAGELVGYWRIMLIPNDKTHSPIRNEETGYADPCQFLVLRDDGTASNITIASINADEESRRKCPDHKKDIDAATWLSGGRNNLSWKMNEKIKGVFMLIEKAKSNGQMWKADFVEEDFDTSSRLSFPLKGGDLILQLLKKVNENTVGPIWPMVLRPVSD